MRVFIRNLQPVFRLGGQYDNERPRSSMIIEWRTVRLTRCFAIAVITSATAAIGVGSGAWACTPTASIKANPVPGVPEGSRAVVVGSSFKAGAPVEIRWNSSSGPLLATAAGPDFATEVAIPGNAKDGMHYLVAVGGDRGQYKAVDTFQVGELGRVVNRRFTSPAPSPLASSRPEFGLPGAAFLSGGLVLLAVGTVLAATRRSRRRVSAER